MADVRGDRTRAALIRAAEELMAAQGIEAVELQDVISRAGQRNRSAIAYHFGGRKGLIRAILTKHRTPINEERNRLLDDLEASDDVTVAAVANAIIRPAAASLGSASGRDFLIILSEQVTHLGWDGLYAARGPVADSVGRGLDLLHRVAPGDEVHRTLRIRQLRLITPVLLADLARDINKGVLSAEDQEALIAQVVDVFTLLLEGEIASSATSDRDRRPRAGVSPRATD